MSKLTQTLATLAFLATVPQFVQADDAIADLSGLIGDINADNAGPELILPSMARSSGSLDFSFMVFRPAQGGTPGSGLYRSTVAAFTLPTATCAGQTANNSDEQWKFLRFGQFVVAGASLSAECTGSQGSASSSNSYVYVVDASSAGNTPLLLQYPGKRLLGLNLVDDLNAAGSASDLMISVLDDSTGLVTVVIRDFLSGGAYSTNTVQAVTQ